MKSLKWKLLRLSTISSFHPYPFFLPPCPSGQGVVIEFPPMKLDTPSRPSYVISSVNINKHADISNMPPSSRVLSLVLLWYYHVICCLSEGGGKAWLLAIHSQLHAFNQVIKIKNTMVLYRPIRNDDVTLAS